MIVLQHNPLQRLPVVLFRASLWPRSYYISLSFDVVFDLLPLCQAYLRALVYYAPNMEALMALFEADLKHHVSVVVSEVAAWVKRFPFSTSDEVWRWRGA